MTSPEQSAVLPENDPSAEPDDAVIGRAFWRSLMVFGVVGGCLAIVAFVLLIRPKPTPPAPKPVEIAQTREVVPVSAPKLPFQDVTSSSGIDFVHRAGARGLKLLPETMGSGCAFLDYDNDGDQDLLLVNGTDWPWDQAAAAESPGKASRSSSLYQNDGTGQYKNVTAESELSVPFYGMGVACGDFDNDGWTDLFFTAVGKNHLFRNEQGKFVDVTESAGIAGTDDQWTTGACWFDYNRDGRLDLFVCRYIQWSRAIDEQQGFSLVGVGRAYGPPMAFQGTFPSLYRNDGQGKFTDVSEQSGVQVRNPFTNVPMGKSLGVIPVDLDRDGWLDLVVANDTVQNFLFHNRRDGTFIEMGAAAGVAFDLQGNARGAMGIDAAGFRNDGAIGLAIGNFSNEMTALYVSQQEPLQFTDEAIASGLGPPSRLDLKFGVCFVDLDLDGRLDLVTANGHLEEEISKVQASQHYAQPPHFFWNCGPHGATEFLPLSAEQIGAAALQPLVGRGLAVADIDNDGDQDLLITANRGAPRLMKNEQALKSHWLRLKLTDTRGPQEAIGARVLLAAGGVTQERQVNPARSYLSQSELVVTFGLGSVAKLDKVVITWPDGEQSEAADLKIDQLNVIQRPAK